VIYHAPKNTSKYYSSLEEIYNIRTRSHISKWDQIDSGFIVFIVFILGITIVVIPVIAST
jgi:hypothetical protein